MHLFHFFYLKWNGEVLITAEKISYLFLKRKLKSQAQNKVHNTFCNAGEHCFFK